MHRCSLKRGDRKEWSKSNIGRDDGQENFQNKEQHTPTDLRSTMNPQKTNTKRSTLGISVVWKSQTTETPYKQPEKIR